MFRHDTSLNFDVAHNNISCHSTMNALSSPVSLKIGIVGFGSFAQFLAQTFIKKGHTLRATSRADYSQLCLQMGVQFFRDLKNTREMFYYKNCQKSHPPLHEATSARDQDIADRMPCLAAIRPCIQRHPLLHHVELFQHSFQLEIKSDSNQENGASSSHESPSG